MQRSKFGWKQRGQRTTENGRKTILFHFFGKISPAARTVADATTIAVTSFARSPLAKACDVVLATGNRNDPRTLELFTTRVVHVSVLGALHAAVTARLPDRGV